MLICALHEESDHESFCATCISSAVGMLLIIPKYRHFDPGSNVHM